MTFLLKDPFPLARVCETTSILAYSHLTVVSRENKRAEVKSGFKKKREVRSSSPVAFNTF